MKRSVLALAIALSSTTALAGPSLHDSLMGVGINSITEWSNCEKIAHKPLVAQDREYHQVLWDGWDHIVIVMCAQELFPNDDLDETTARLKLEAYRDQIQRISRVFPESAWVISFKGYEPVGGWSVKGVKQTKLYQRIESSSKMQDQFVRFWQLAAEIFREEQRVAFNLMNEPEWTGWGGKREWLALATRAGKAVREISPGRTIILEGTNKSLVGRHSATHMLEPIGLDNVIYAFHYYGAAKERWGQYPYKTPVSLDAHSADAALKDITRFKHKYGVPTALTEIGIIANSPGTRGGVPEQDRVNFVLNKLMPWHKNCGCGITWWALADRNTPYRRLEDRDWPKAQSYPRTPDTALFEALELKR